MRVVLAVPLDLPRGRPVASQADLSLRAPLLVLRKAVPRTLCGSPKASLWTSLLGRPPRCGLSVACAGPSVKRTWKLVSHPPSSSFSPLSDTRRLLQCDLRAAAQPSGLRMVMAAGALRSRGRLVSFPWQSQPQ